MGLIRPQIHRTSKSSTGSTTACRAHGSTRSTRRASSNSGSRRRLSMGPATFSSCCRTGPLWTRCQSATATRQTKGPHVRAPLLSLSLLEQFEARLARRAPDVLRQLGEQGATDEDIDRATDALDGHHLPSEAITWWRWRNPPAEVEIVPVLTFVPLETAVFARRVRLEMREDAADYAARHGAATLADPDLWWSPAWLPFIGPFQRDITCIDCAVSTASRRLFAGSTGKPSATHTTTRQYRTRSARSSSAGSLSSTLAHTSAITIPGNGFQSSPAYPATCPTPPDTASAGTSSDRSLRAPTSRHAGPLDIGTPTM